MLEELLANINFWYARKFIEHGKHYEFMFDASNSSAMAVRILKKYPGVIVEYSNIHMSSENQMSFDMDVVANPKLLDVESKRFKDFTTDIFRSILNASIKNALKDQDENRNTDPLQSDSERGFYEEVSAVSEERVPERKPRKKGVRRSKKLHSEVQQPSPNSGSGDQP